MESASTQLPLPQTHCAVCGYCLNGLPPCGRCPECAEPYDNQTLILSGWPPERLRPDPTAMVFSVAATGLAVSFWFSAGLGLILLLSLPLLTNGKSVSWKGIGGGFLFLSGYATAGMILFSLSRRLRRYADRLKIDITRLGKPAFQLRLFPEGYAFRRGFGPPHELFSWLPDLVIDLTLAGAVARLRIARNNPLGYTDWSTLVDFSFPATADQVTALKTYINALRSAAPPSGTDR